MGKYNSFLAKTLNEQESDQSRQEKLKKENRVTDDVYVKRSGLRNPDIPVYVKICRILLIVIIPLAVIGLFSLMIRGCREDLFQFIGILPRV